MKELKKPQKNVEIFVIEGCLPEKSEKHSRTVKRFFFFVLSNV